MPAAHEPSSTAARQRGAYYERIAAHHMTPLWEVLHALVPRVAQIVMNSSFRMFPDSAAAKGDKDKKYQPSAEAIAMQQMMRGIHF